MAQYVSYSAHCWGKENFPLLVEQRDNAPDLPVRGWSLHPIPCLDGVATGYFVDAMGGSGPYSWSVRAKDVLPGCVPPTYDLLVVEVRPCDHRLLRKKWSDWKVFSNGHINEVVTGALGQMTGLANVGLDVRVFSIFVDAHTDWEKLAAELPTAEIAKAATSCLVTYAWPSRASAPNAARGMFSAAGVYAFLKKAEGLLRVSIPGMPISLYEVMTSKAYHIDPDIAPLLAPTVAVARRDFLGDREATLAAVSAGLQEGLKFVKRGNAWGNSGTHAVRSTEELDATLSWVFTEEGNATCAYVQQAVPRVVAEMRSIRFAAGDRRASRVVYMALEDYADGAPRTGPRSIPEEEVLDRVFAGDTAKRDDALDQMRRITQTADAFCARFGSLPTDHRVDALLDGENKVWLVELTEQNASLCGLPPQARFDGIACSLLGREAVFDLRPRYG
jgi:hypothetical protein